jgi:hypothetical protein
LTVRLGRKKRLHARGEEVLQRGEGRIGVRLNVAAQSRRRKLIQDLLFVRGERLMELGVGSEVADEQLQRDVAAEAGVMSQVDGSRPPRPSRASIQ